MNTLEQRPSRIGPDYVRKLRLKIEGGRLEMRTTVNFLAALAAWVVAVVASCPVTFYLASRGVLPEYPPGIYALWLTLTILGVTVAGGTLYILVACLMRRHIVLDRDRRQVLVNGRVIADQQDISQVERGEGLLFWSPLLLRFRNRGKIILLWSPALHSSPDEAAKRIADFLGVPYKDYSDGDYIAILGLTVDRDRLLMRPPNEALARWITYVFGGVMGAGALYLALYVFPRQTGHTMTGGRGLVYIVFGAAAAVHYIVAHLFHHRIVLDRNKGVITGRKSVCPLAAIDHVGIHIGKDYSYHLSLVKTDGREIPIVTYGGRPRTTGEAAKVIAEFLRVPVRDYYAEAARNPAK